MMLVLNPFMVQFNLLCLDFFKIYTKKKIMIIFTHYKKKYSVNLSHKKFQASLISKYKIYKLIIF